jgi:hypothetical protein
MASRVRFSSATELRAGKALDERNRSVASSNAAWLEKLLSFVVWFGWNFLMDFLDDLLDGIFLKLSWSFWYGERSSGMSEATAN